MNSGLYRYLMTFFVVTPMTFLLAVCNCLLSSSFYQNDWVKILITSWLTVLPIAYLFALAIIPLAKKITDRIFGYRKD